MLYIVSMANYNIDSAEHCGGKCRDLFLWIISLKVCAMLLCSVFPETWQNKKKKDKEVKTGVFKSCVNY